MTDKPKSNRGFASMAKTNPDRQRELSSKGGSSVPPEKRPFYTDPGLASVAGKLGGAMKAKLDRARKDAAKR